MIVTIVGLALAAPSNDLEPLSEEQQLVNLETVAVQYGVLDVPKVGALGWTKTTVQRGELEGVGRYLVLQEGEILDFEALEVRSSESRGLYDLDFNLEHEVWLDQPLGGEEDPLELKWGDKGFRWRRGRDRWSPGVKDVRPTATTEIPLFVHGVELPTPWVGHVFDQKSLEVETRTLQAGQKSSIKDEGVMIFKVEGAEPMRHVVGDDGVFVESRGEGFRILGAQPREGLERELCRRVADNAAFEEAINLRLPASWSEGKGSYTNSMLGMSLKLPKGWHRATKREVKGTHFHAFSEDSNAYVSLAVTVLGSEYTFDGWKTGLLEFFTERAVKGKLKSRRKTYAKQEAFSIEYVRAGEAQFDTQVYAWKRGGLGFLLSGGAWVEGSKKIHRETESVLKSVKFAR